MLFFADEQDRALIVERLNADPEIAFIVPDGPMDPKEAVMERYRASPEAALQPFGLGDTGYRQRWRAVKEVVAVRDGRHSLWHVPSGALPLLPDYAKTGVPIGGPPDPDIPDPWSGWIEQRPPGETPYFGPGCHAEIRLVLWTRHRPYTQFELAVPGWIDARWDRSDDLLVASSFEWTGGYFHPAPPQTDRWWNRLKSWVMRTTTKLPAVENRRITFHAFPSALAKLRDGMRYESSGWDLDASIRDASTS